MMSGPLSIPISGLKEGHHSFDFKINNAFFEQFEGSEVKEGELAVNIEADKMATHMDLVISITGTVNLSCDRCLGIFSQPVSCVNRLLVKFRGTYEDSDPDMVITPGNIHDLDLKQFFYEYILLALPIKRMHPDDISGSSTCDPGMLQKLKEHIVSEDPETDPRWDELKKLMKNN